MIGTIIGGIIAGLGIGTYLNKKEENEELKKRVKKLEDEKNSRSSEDILRERLIRKDDTENTEEVETDGED